MEDFIIADAGPEDASLIADAILGAIGEDITDHLAGEKNTREDVHAIFRRLAERDDSQYSYLNSRIAIDTSGNPMGVCVSYDGADLKRLRRPFFDEANAVLGWGMTADEIEDLPGETDGEEYYLDTIMTLPQYRGKGVGEALIRDAKKKAGKAGKPLGLLCDIDNIRARQLYERIGFRPMGRRPFAGHDMNHLRF